MDINYHSLQYFYICAEHQSMSKAALTLGVSQPSLSMQIKALEEQIGFELFFRNGKSINLTKKGEELYKTSQHFFDLNKKILSCLTSQKKDISQESFNIGVSDQVDRPIVAEMVSNVMKSKKVKTTIYSYTSTKLLEMAKKKEISFLVAHEKMKLKWSHLVFEYPVYFVTSKKTQAPTFENAENIKSILNYFGEDLIIPSTDLKLGKEYSSFSRSHGLTTDVIMESNIISCLVRSVADGLGCSFLPLPFLKSSFFEKHINTFGPKEGYWKHSIHLYADIPQSELLQHPVVKKFRSFQLVESSLRLSERRF